MNAINPLLFPFPFSIFHPGPWTSEINPHPTLPQLEMSSIPLDDEESLIALVEAALAPLLPPLPPTTSCSSFAALEPPSHLSSFIDHTLLTPLARSSEISKLCLEAVKYGFASVCVNSSYAHLAKSQIALHRSALEASSSPVTVPKTFPKVCCVISFPNGASSPSCKAAEASECVRLGADEIDMVINYGLVKELAAALALHDDPSRPPTPGFCSPPPATPAAPPSTPQQSASQLVSSLLEDVSAVCSSIASASGGAVLLKVILECGALSPVEVVLASLLCVHVRDCLRSSQPPSSAGFGPGPHFLKTSTGYNGYGGASVPSVHLLSSCALRSRSKGGLLVKASGGVGDGEAARRVIEAGAMRIGASKGVSIVEGGEAKTGGGY